MIRNLKHLIATALLAVIGAVSAWAQPAAVKPTQGDGSKSAPYVLNTVENMKWLMDNYKANAKTDCGLDFAAANYRLGANIDLASITNWEPLGGNYFTGTFDGGGHTLSYLTCSGVYVGLFMNLGNCTISDLTLADVNLHASSSVGAVAAYGSSTTPVHPFTLRNITVTGTISTTGREAGGLVGSSAAGEIYNCTNGATVTAGGGYVGGIVGQNTYAASVMEGCANFGVITSNYDNVGGLAGYYVGRISNCNNKGEVKLTNRYCAGGIAGYFGGDGSTIDHCLNEGNVSGPNFAGFLVGQSQDDVTMTNCGWDASAKLNGNTNTYASAVYGYADTTPTMTDVMPFSASDLSSGKATYLLQDDQPTLWWSQRVGSESYPIFRREHDNFRVYFQGTIHCDGSYDGQFTNSSATTWREDHNFGTTGICSRCSEATPAPLVAGVYQIGNAGQLLWFSRLLRDGNKANSNAVLTDDIDLSVFCHPADYVNYLESVDWEPIGDKVSSYLGTFDGQNHTISGLYMGQRTDGRCGLFYGLSIGATVKNLNFADVNINLPECDNVGAVAGTMQREGCLVHNVHVRSGSIVAKDNVGGLVGVTYDHDAAITDCSNAASISGSSNVGGILGYNMYRSTVSGCTNSGAIASTGYYAGGIIGNSDNAKVTVTNCLNRGAVSAGNHAGGIIGDFAVAEISGCGNEGAVTASSRAGGIVGWMRGASSVVSMCYNVANFDYGDKAASSIGGIAGCSSDGQIVDCYNFGNLTGRHIDKVGGILGGTTSDLPQLAYCLNEGNVVAGNDECGLISGTTSVISVSACYAKAECTIAYYENSQYIDLLGAKRFCRSAKPAPLVGNVIAADATEDDYVSGALAYALQGGRTGIHWGQDFSNYDTEPHLGSDKTVYFSGTVNCAGETVDGFFTNVVVAPVLQDHVFDKFDVCTGCHKGHEPTEEYGMRQISTVGHLVWLQQEVEAGHNDHDAFLVNDIDLADYCAAQPDGKGWKPIGSREAPYKGTFNGNSRWITGLKINRPDENFVGLFRYVDGGIENLTVRGEVHGGGYTAILCGQAQPHSSFHHCYIIGEVSGGSRVGGITGYTYGPITYCTNMAIVRGKMYVGGIVGESEQEITDCSNTGSIYRLDYVDSNCRIGGIVGLHNHTSKLLRCENYGSINAKGGYYVGGIAGWIAQIGSAAGASYCINNASVTGAGNVGGIVGYTNTTSLDRCFSKGDITSAYDTCGAISGYLASDASGSAPQLLYYDASSTMTVGDSPVAMTDAHGGIGATEYEVRNGAVAARIGLPFGQEIGVETSPTLGGLEVWYGKYLIHADEEPAYATPCGSNSEQLTEAYEPHHIVGGVCTICGRHDGEAISRQPAASYEDWESTIQGQSNATDSHSWTFTGAEAGDNIEFDWSVSSEERYDWLRVYITTPGGERTQLLEQSGEQAAHFTYGIKVPGTYILEAEYSKDGSDNSGTDTATLTNVTGPKMANAGINADLTGEGDTDLLDVNYLRSVLTRYTKPDDARCDFNGDGRVTIADLNILIQSLLP